MEREREREGGGIERERERDKRCLYVWRDTLMVQSQGSSHRSVYRTWFYL